jgi:hypothetical protein
MVLTVTSNSLMLWHLSGMWTNVVSHSVLSAPPSTVKILIFHFRGESHQPVQVIRDSPLMLTPTWMNAPPSGAATSP